MESTLKQGSVALRTGGIYWCKYLQWKSGVLPQRAWGWSVLPREGGWSRGMVAGDGREAPQEQAECWGQDYDADSGLPELKPSGAETTQTRRRRGCRANLKTLKPRWSKGNYKWKPANNDMSESKENAKNLNKQPNRIISVYQSPGRKKARKPIKPNCQAGIAKQLVCKQKEKNPTQVNTIRKWAEALSLKCRNMRETRTGTKDRTQPINKGKSPQRQ